MKRGETRYLSQDDSIYVSDTQYSERTIFFSINKPGQEKSFGKNRMIGRDHAGRPYVRDEGTPEGTYVSSPKGRFVEIFPTDRYVHFGKFGKVSVSEQIIAAPQPQPIARPTQIAQPGHGAPAIPGKIIPANPARPQQLARAGQPAQIDVVGKVAGSDIDIHDRDWRNGQYGEAVLALAKGVVQADHGRAYPVYGDRVDAAKAAGFVRGIYSRRLNSPRDLIPIKVDSVTDSHGTTLYRPWLTIGKITGVVTLNGKLQPLGLTENPDGNRIFHSI
jgi:hypothetical protein